MGEKLARSVYLVLRPEIGRYSYNQGRATDFNVTNMTKGKPRLAVGEVAVRVRLSIDSSLFEEFIPVIEATIEGHDIIAPEVEVIDQPGNSE